MKTVHVEVTEEDIQAGVPKEADSCPIARALGRIVKHDLQPIVETDSLYFPTVRQWESCTFVPYGKWPEVRPPAAVQRFIIAFDASPVSKVVPAPFAFDIDLPEEILP